MNEYEKAVNELSLLDNTFSENADYDSNFQDLCYDIVEKFKGYENPRDTVSAIFECFEKQPTGNFGIHAELFEFVESFDVKLLTGELLKSINRKAVPQTVWILKKVINTSNGEDKQRFVELLSRISKDDIIDEKTRGTARMFLDSGV